MHATIQKPIEEIVGYIKNGEKVFVVGCNNCAWKCHSGGEDETQNMAKRLEKRGIEVVGYSTPGPQGMSLCKLDHTRKVLMDDYAEQVQQADSFLVLACGQGIHTVIDATEGGMVHPGCDTTFGGETVFCQMEPPQILDGQPGRGDLLLSGWKKDCQQPGLIRRFNRPFTIIIFS
ncbi:MAG: hypothetical protein B6240_01885 [Desulfobacteraceae bacterium 4572_87]|nr:MAG: hypothetical protein B6240_01885 [Desulfobacteraceae bacterium 4572_87]